MWQRIYLKLRQGPRSDNWIYAVLLIYISLVVIIALKHEPWFDEAQAWLIARDSNLIDLFVTYLRYEGNPGLWHLLLMLPAKLNLPYYWVSIVSIIIASLSVFVFLKYSPFPYYIKILFPFSYYMFFQYAVVARAYVLIPLFLFAIATQFKKRTTSYLWILLLSLLALVSIHGTFIAIAIIIFHFSSLNGAWQSLPFQIRLKQVIALVSFAILLILIFLELFPPKDLLVSGGVSFDEKFNLTHINISETIVTTVTIISDSFLTNYFTNEIDFLKKPYYLLPFLMTYLIFYLTVKWLYLKKLHFLYLLPLALLILLNIKYCAPWHIGILLILWIFVLWIGFDKASINQEKTIAEKKLQTVICLLLFGVLLVQVSWSIRTSIYDFTNSYSASPQVAEYIKKNNLTTHKLFVRNFMCLAVEPYFTTNIFYNYNNQKKPAFWRWSSNNKLQDDLTLLSKSKPDYIIINFFHKKISDQEIVPLSSYKFVKKFTGGMYIKDNVHSEEVFLIYKKCVSDTNFNINHDDVLRFINMWRDIK